MLYAQTFLDGIRNRTILPDPQPHRMYVGLFLSKPFFNGPTGPST